MRIPQLCTECFTQSIESESGAKAFVGDAEVRDDGVYTFECPHGHKTTGILVAQKFQLLFEIGSHAIIDGYYREAVSSFTSCLERFYEFYIKTMCHKYQVDVCEFDRTWKLIGNQSERQLGAFAFLYLLENQKSPKLLPDKKVSFRNSVIHKGKIPERSESLEYGEQILEMVRSSIEEIEVRNPNLLQDIAHRLTLELTQEAAKSDPPLSTSLGFDLIIPLPPYGKQSSLTLEQNLQLLERNRLSARLQEGKFVPLTAHNPPVE